MSRKWPKNDPEIKYFEHSEVRYRQVRLNESFQKMYNIKVIHKPFWPKLTLYRPTTQKLRFYDIIKWGVNEMFLWKLCKGVWYQGHSLTWLTQNDPVWPKNKGFQYSEVRYRKIRLNESF
jgi:hypothetical protein